MHDSPPPGDLPLHAEQSAPQDLLLGRVLALVRLLRARCPWDARQDPRSLRPYLLEEAHEVAEAIDEGDDRSLRNELGDLLLNLAFQIVLAEERGAFDTREVVERLEAKMEARHPHIYGDAEQPPDWEALKARERRDLTRDPLEGIPSRLEPLDRALRILDRAAGLGFEWPDRSAALDKLAEEVGELRELLAPRTGGATEAAVSAAPRSPYLEMHGRIEAELGDLLLAAVAVARAFRAHPANALRSSIARFEARFRVARRLAEERSLRFEDASPEELAMLWRDAKQAETEGAED